MKLIALVLLCVCACAARPHSRDARRIDPCATCRAKYNAATRPYVACNVATRECYVPDDAAPQTNDWPPLE